MWLFALLAVVLAFALLVGWAQLGLWSARPVIYTLRTAAELEPFVKSWGPWLETGGRLVIQDQATQAEAEFRKRRYKSRPDALLFRVRNADTSRPYFAAVQQAMAAAGVVFDLEVTPKRRRARALAVRLDPASVVTPLAAARLVEVAFAATGAERDGLRVWCEGRMRQGPDGPSVVLLPWRQDHWLGLRLGQFVGALGRRFLGVGPR